MHSTVRWSTAIDIATWSSPVQVVGMFLPHMTFSAAALMVLSWFVASPLE